MTMRAVWLLGMCASGCFVDALGVADGGGAPGSGAGGEASPTSGSSTSSVSSGGAEEGGAGGDDGGGGASPVGGSGGEGGDGGAPSCVGYLALDAIEGEHDRAEIDSHPSFQPTGDFAFGVTVRLHSESFALDDGDYDSAFVFEHHDGADGYSLGFIERYNGESDDGEAHPFVAVQLGDNGCIARGEPFPLGAWHRIAGTYDVRSRTVKLHVDGIEVDSDTCDGSNAGGTIDAPFAIGSSGSGFHGDVDDLFLRSSATLPPAATPIICSGGTIAAFDFDALSLKTVCPGTAHTFSLLESTSDPEHVCL